jgi:hypothetical protein
MKTKTLFVSLVVLVLLCATTQAFGQESKQIKVTIFGGGSFLKADRTFNDSTGNPILTNYANGGKLGFRGTVDLSKHWALEGTYAFGRNNFQATQVSGPGAGTQAFGTRVQQLAGNMLYYVTATDKVRLFGTAGIGLGRFSPTDAAVAALQTSGTTIVPVSKADFNFGGGLETRLSSWLGARFDVRDHLSGIPTYGVPQSPSANGFYYPVTGRVHNIETTLGLVLYVKK